MKHLVESVLAKGIMHDKETGLCVFEIYQDDLKWFNIHIDNIEGKFYLGCKAKLDKYNDGLLKVVILEPDTKEEKS